ncbi:hypothetical protein LPJ53_003175 [Coemansia erecta]|uniref:Endoplasmic reticulum junction formation protein lunapark n=1 Tax=Coemansia erecta TaxID=147472 RepID=A0A9W7XWS9_9FUNG|nr:hypothetical protein LPJ53_003175 [Coemansia erecta]
MRSITISVTTMPPPIASCKPAIASGARDMLNVVLGMIAGRTKECTDMVFSGHTVILMVSFLFWTRYACHWTLVVYSAIHTVLGVASVLLVRYHYTLDVVLALFFTFFVHHLYYRSLETAIEQRVAIGRWSRFAAINNSACPRIVQSSGGFAYSRVGPENGGCVGCEMTGTDSARDMFSHSRHSAGGSIKSSSEIVEMAALTLTANTPEQEPRRTTSSDDIGKALEAAPVDEGYCSPVAGFADDDDEAQRHYGEMLMINRYPSNYLATAKEDNYEQILASLEQEIRQAEKQRVRAVNRVDWWSRNWVFYVGIGWLAYVAGFVLYVWPERNSSHADDLLFHLVSVVVLLVVLYYGRVVIRSLGQRAVVRNERVVDELKEQLKARLDELKKKTAFDTTKTLIDKYSIGERQEKAMGASDRMRQQQQQMEMKGRRQTMPDFDGSPRPQGGVADANAPAAGGGTQRQLAIQRQLQMQQQQSMNAAATTLGTRVGGPMSPGSTGVVKLPGRSASLQPMDSPVKGSGTRPWLDKLVDQLVGDVGGADDRYALICRSCYAHNGLVLEEEINDIQYNCPKCGKFNPSLRTLRLHSRAGSQQILRGSVEHPNDYSDYDEYSNYSGNDDEDGGSAGEEHEVSLEDKSIQANMSGEFGTPTPKKAGPAKKRSVPQDLKLLDDDDDNESAQPGGNPEDQSAFVAPEAAAAVSKTPRTPKNRRTPMKTGEGSRIKSPAASKSSDPEPLVVSEGHVPDTPSKSGSGSGPTPHKRRANKSKPV